MACRIFTEFSNSLERKSTELFATVIFNGTGQPTLVGNSSTLANQSKGIRSFVRTGVGLFTISFGNSNATQSSSDLYSRVLFFEGISVGAVAGNVIGVRMRAINVSAASGSIDFDIFRAGAIIDPGVGSTCVFRIVLKDSAI